MLRFAIIMLMVFALLHSFIVVAEDIDSLIAPRVERAMRLYEGHVDVFHVIQEIDRAVRLWGSGDRDGALRVLESVDLELSRLEEVAGRVQLLYYARLGFTIAFLASVPILFYLLFPRVYLWVWFKLRRGWVVRTVLRR